MQKKNYQKLGAGIAINFVVLFILKSQVLQSMELPFMGLLFIFLVILFLGGELFGLPKFSYGPTVAAITVFCFLFFKKMILQSNEIAMDWTMVFTILMIGFLASIIKRWNYE